MLASEEKKSLNESLNDYLGALLKYGQKYFYDLLDRSWHYVPRRVGLLLGTLVVFIAGFAIRGSWMLVLVSLIKQFGDESLEETKTSSEQESKFTDIDSRTIPDLSPFCLEYYNLQGLPFYLLWNLLAGYIVYFPICGFLQWYYYIRQKDRPEDWKCQPRKFLTWKDEKHEIILGSCTLTVVCTYSSFFSCYFENGGINSTLYFKISDMGWLYYFFSIPIIFLFTDAAIYYAHRFFHLPFMYRHFHKLHHRYKQPTAFSATAAHPIEMLIYESLTYLPIFILPVHWSVFVGNYIYVFYYSIMDHSGIKMESWWPWQPNTTFHDNHHQYFHCNFGFNTDLWDKLHGTYRVKDRIYNENIFYGAGLDASKARKEDLEDHIDNIKDD